MSRLRVGSKACTCRHTQHDTRLIAITGGPGGGKTAILEIALRSFCQHVGMVPEAASVIFGGGFPRHESAVARRAAQRAIFHVQREMEALVMGEQRVAVALCDRGTVDGVAYWPDSPDSYWTELGTSLDEELNRYAAVIHLRTPAANEGYNREYALRVESAAEAHEIDQRILAAWQAHPNRLVVPSEADFLVKALRALELVRTRLPRCCHAHPLPREGGS